MKDNHNLGLDIAVGAVAVALIFNGAATTAGLVCIAYFMLRD